MEALKYMAEVGSEGNLLIPGLRLEKGTAVEVIVLVREQPDDFSDLTAASETSLAFWDNPIDDEVWNDA